MVNLISKAINVETAKGKGIDKALLTDMKEYRLQIVKLNADAMVQWRTDQHKVIRELFMPEVIENPRLIGEMLYYGDRDMKKDGVSMGYAEGSKIMHLGSTLDTTHLYTMAVGKQIKNEIGLTEWEALGGTEQINRINNATASQIKEANEIVVLAEEAVKAEGAEVLGHELIHVATVATMVTEPDTAGVAKLREMYKLAMKSENEINAKLGMYSGITVNKNWMTNEYEFVAEALTNDKLMTVLSTMKVGKKDMLTNILNTVLSMLGITDDTMLAHIMDGYQAVMDRNTQKVYQYNGKMPGPGEVDSFYAGLQLGNKNKNKEVVVDLTPPC